MHQVEEQELAAGQSSFINKAYEALLKPLTRGFYLLELRGVPLEEVEEAVNPAFLMEIMETNEDIIDVASNPPVLQQIQEANNAKMDDCVQVVAEAFRNGDFALAKNTLIKLKYFTNIDGKIKGIQRNNMDST
ncbi:iron-sulfur cluster co-chaperone protein HscB-like isoform X2 [Mya arenaria]|uniref:iron-sulfur cluster co-chaperone protein HscB-like isoform X2 n=1 Tax=Mya arenaria TaxID=6604 RepID=UPI0022DF3725|nr:iron-sulfur cluster co-chaperone protein HscB-like isoform X2 [Mya arenaria]